MTVDALDRDTPRLARLLEVEMTEAVHRFVRAHRAQLTDDELAVLDACPCHSPICPRPHIMIGVRGRAPT
jgi:hypothetical protein